MSSNILTEACQWLLSLEISALCEQLEDHLSLCIAAAKSKLVRPQVQKFCFISILCYILVL